MSNKEKEGKKGLRVMLLRIFVLLSSFYFCMLHAACAYADDLFATGWGKAVDNSPEGQLVFIVLQVAGIYSCIKSLRLLYGYHNGTQTQYGSWKCTSMFIAGTLLFYGHETANFIYNSF